jgi:hypothetical protein
VLPNLQVDPQAGYSIGQVTSGPNTGLWYVTDVRYYMERVSGMNPQVTANGSAFQLPEGSQANECRTNMGLGPSDPVHVYYHTFNSRCKGVDMGAVIQAIWGHEGFGANGGTGHESRAHALASQVQYDPHALIEDTFDPVEADLRTKILNAVWDLNVRLSGSNNGGAGDHTYVTGNWPGELWLWYWDGAGQYVHAKQPI